MNSIKRMGFVVLSLVGIFMVFQVDAMQITPYGKPSKGFKGSTYLSQPVAKAKRPLEIKSKDYARPAKKQKTAKHENQTSEEKPMTESDWQAIDTRVKLADKYKIPVLIMTPELQLAEKRELQRKQREESWTKKDNDDFFEKLCLSKQEQIELSKTRAINESKILLEDRKKRREEKERQAKENPIVIEPARSEYGQSIQKFKADRNEKGIPNGPLNEFVFYVAEGKFNQALLTAQMNSRGFQFFPPTAALLEIGDPKWSQKQQDPKVLHAMLHSESMGYNLPAIQVDKCARYFAKEAGNTKYLKLNETINK